MDDLIINVNDILWLIWDSQDGQQVVINSKDYVMFCEKTEKDHWGFRVSILKLGVFSHELEEVDTYKLNLIVDNNKSIERSSS